MGAHPGVLKLAAWSHALWHSGRYRGVVASSGPGYWEHGILCGALLMSVPEAAVSSDGAQAASAAAAWAAVADCLTAGTKVEASTWRLAVRLAGFAMDRHSRLRTALCRAVRGHGSTKLCPPKGAMPSTDDEDEFAFADRAAETVLRRFLEGAADFADGDVPEVFEEKAEASAA